MPLVMINLFELSKENKNESAVKGLYVNVICSLKWNIEKLVISMHNTRTREIE